MPRPPEAAGARTVSGGRGTGTSREPDDAPRDGMADDGEAGTVWKRLRRTRHGRPSNSEGSAARAHPEGRPGEALSGRAPVPNGDRPAVCCDAARCAVAARGRRNPATSQSGPRTPGPRVALAEQHARRPCEACAGASKGTRQAPAPGLDERTGAALSPGRVIPRRHRAAVRRDATGGAQSAQGPRHRHARWVAGATPGARTRESRRKVPAAKGGSLGQGTSEVAPSARGDHRGAHAHRRAARSAGHDETCPHGPTGDDGHGHPRDGSGQRAATHHGVAADAGRERRWWRRRKGA